MKRFLHWLHRNLLHVLYGSLLVWGAFETWSNPDAFFWWFMTVVWWVLWIVMDQGFTRLRANYDREMDEHVRFTVEVMEKIALMERELRRCRAQDPAVIKSNLTPTA